VRKKVNNDLKNEFKYFFELLADAIMEPGDDPEVIRAKYFIRDEFLVSKIHNIIVIIV
jgi:hypothetical protein